MARRYVLIGILLVVTLALIVALWQRPVANHPFFAQFEAGPLVFAHADDTGQGLWPGNTMLFLENVAGQGVDVLEMDVHLTQDGHLVLMHDQTVDRTTDGTGRVADLTLAQLQELEVGGNWTADGGQTYPYRGQGLRVPALAAVFERFPGYPMNIEIKEARLEAAWALCELLRAHGREHQVLVASFSDQAMAAFRDACPEVATSGSRSEVQNFVLLSFISLSNLLRPDYEAHQVPVASGAIPVIRPGFVRAAHGHNLQVHVWTINDPAEMQRLLDMGVDGIMTDRPDLLFELLGR